MVGVLADERMYEFTGGEPPTVDRLRQRYRALARGRSPSGDEWWFNWIVRMPGDPVGVVQATVTADRSSAEVAWEVGVPWQGQGIAGEAAQAMVDWLRAAGVTRRAGRHPPRPRGVGGDRRPHRPGPVDGTDRRRGGVGQSSNGRGMNSAEPGEAPAMASAARITAAAVYDVCSSNGNGVGRPAPSSG